jgi:putative photosynthetic complex assembly protein 2
MTHWSAAIAALFIWWFSTGLILWRVRSADNNGGPDQHLWSVLLGLPLLAAGIYGAITSLGDTSTFGTYTAFLSALAIWAWIELAFLSGIITGPVTTPCPRGIPEWARFVRAFGTLAWHECLLSAALLALWFVSRDMPNQFALWTFGVLFFARISAKLNLFLGVPRINVEFLPHPLHHLASYFRIAPMNAVFPLSITILTFAVACMFNRLYLAQSPDEVAGFALLAALTSLALLEHWFMVLPLPDQKLWRWMLPAPKPILKDRLKEDIHGL